MISTGQFNYFPAVVVVRFCSDYSERGNMAAPVAKSNVFEIGIKAYLKDTGIHVEAATELPLQEGVYCT